MASLEKTVDDIKHVKVQGAKEIAVYALKFLREFCKKNGFKLKFEVAAWKLEEARPTAVVLHNCLEILKKKRSLKTIDMLLKKLNESNRKIARKGSSLIKNRYRIITHCHSGEALAVIKKAWKDGKKISVIATETDPLEQGEKTAKELAKLKIPVTLVTDSAAGHFMKEANCAIVGCDAIRKKEGVINKTGTYLIALAAKENKKPFYVVGNLLKLDKRKKFVIEERPKREVYNELMHPGKLTGIKLRNPAFDATPWDFVTAVITEKGIMKPKQILRLLK